MTRLVLALVMIVMTVITALAIGCEPPPTQYSSAPFIACKPGEVLYIVANKATGTRASCAVPPSATVDAGVGADSPIRSIRGHCDGREVFTFVGEKSDQKDTE